jgi:hypothetical protein
MAEYRTRVVTVQAFQWCGGEDNAAAVEFFDDPTLTVDYDTERNLLGVRRGEYGVRVHPGDWLVMQADGHILILSREQFEEQYERVD